MSSDLAELRQIIEVFGATEEEAAAALVSAFKPPSPGGTVAAWRRQDYFGRSAPTPQAVWEVYRRADFRCEVCGSTKGLTVDHINSDPTDHRPANLRSLCRACNRPRGDTCSGETHHHLQMVRQALKAQKAYFSHTTLREAAGLPKGGCTYFVKFLRHRLGWWGRVKRLVGG